MPCDALNFTTVQKITVLYGVTDAHKNKDSTLHHRKITIISDIFHSFWLPEPPIYVHIQRSTTTA